MNIQKSHTQRILRVAAAAAAQAAAEAACGPCCQADTQSPALEQLFPYLLTARLEDPDVWMDEPEDKRTGVQTARQERTHTHTYINEGTSHHSELRADARGTAA